LSLEKLNVETKPAYVLHAIRERLNKVTGLSLITDFVKKELSERTGTMEDIVFILAYL